MENKWLALDIDGNVYKEEEVKLKYVLERSKRHKIKSFNVAGVQLVMNKNAEYNVHGYPAFWINEMCVDLFTHIYDVDILGLEYYRRSGIDITDGVAGDSILKYHILGYSYKYKEDPPERVLHHYLFINAQTGEFDLRWKR